MNETLDSIAPAPDYGALEKIIGRRVFDTAYPRGWIGPPNDCTSEIKSNTPVAIGISIANAYRVISTFLKNLKAYKEGRGSMLYAWMSLVKDIYLGYLMYLYVLNCSTTQGIIVVIGLHVLLSLSINKLVNFLGLSPKLSRMVRKNTTSSKTDASKDTTKMTDPQESLDSILDAFDECVETNCEVTTEKLNGDTYACVQNCIEDSKAWQGVDGGFKHLKDLMEHAKNSYGFKPGEVY